VPTRKAHRAIKAKRIIRHAYGRTRASQAIRFELLGDFVAVAVVRDVTATAEVVIKVARELPDGRASRMLKESRKGFASVREQIRYFESLYERFGNPE
jgi:hypothetical protein